jgi:hypothetical protein
MYKCLCVGWDSVVGIAICYGLDGLRIKHHEGKIFCTCTDHPRGPSSFLYKEYSVSLRRVKGPGHGVDHPPQSSTEIKERLQLYLYSHSGPSWPILGSSLLLPLQVLLLNIMYMEESKSFQNSGIIYSKNGMYKT